MHAPRTPASRAEPPTRSAESTAPPTPRPPRPRNAAHTPRPQFASRTAVTTDAPTSATTQPVRIPAPPSSRTQPRRPPPRTHRPGEFATPPPQPLTRPTPTAPTKPPPQPVRNPQSPTESANKHPTTAAPRWSPQHPAGRHHTVPGAATPLVIAAHLGEARRLHRTTRQSSHRATLNHTANPPPNTTAKPEPPGAGPAGPHHEHRNRPTNKRSPHAAHGPTHPRGPSSHHEIPSHSTNPPPNATESLQRTDSRPGRRGQLSPPRAARE